MKILLDTHILIWVFADDERISKTAQKIIGSSKNEIFFSVASVWEVAIKYGLKASDMPFSDEEFVNYCLQSNFKMLSIKPEHILALKTLKREKNAPPHKDPFDRILIAQAKLEDMIFLTHDKLLPHYNEPCIMFV